MATNAQQLERMAQRAGLKCVEVEHRGNGQGYEVWVYDPDATHINLTSQGMWRLIGEYPALYIAKQFLPKDAARIIGDCPAVTSDHATFLNAAMSLMVHAENCGLYSAYIFRHNHDNNHTIELWANQGDESVLVTTWSSFHNAQNSSIQLAVEKFIFDHPTYGRLPSKPTVFVPTEDEIREVMKSLFEANPLLLQDEPITNSKQSPKVPAGTFIRWGMHKRKVQWILIRGSVALSAESVIDHTARAPMMTAKGEEWNRLDRERHALEMLEHDAFVEETKAAAAAELETHEIPALDESVLFEAAPEPQPQTLKIKAQISYAYSPRERAGNTGCEHIQVLEDVQIGRMKRKAYQALCGGKHWGLTPLGYTDKPNCKRCIEIAERHHIEIISETQPSAVPHIQSLIDQNVWRA